MHAKLDIHHWTIRHVCFRQGSAHKFGLKFLYTGAVSYSNAYFGMGSGITWLDYLRCGGTESTILDCSHNGFGLSHYYYCGHNHDAGVECGTRGEYHQLIRYGFITEGHIG